jgi:hypothetical protein
MSVAGTWNLVMLTPIGERKATLSVTEAGGALTGTLMNDEGGRAEIRDGKASGDSLSFSADVKSPMPLTLDFKAKVDGNAISGNVSAGGIGSWGFNGTRA